MLGAIVGGLRVRYRHVEAADLAAPPGYLAAKKLGALVAGGDTGTGNATVLAIWFKRGALGGVWVSRMNSDRASYIGHGELYLKAFEQGMKVSAEKQGRSL